MCNKSQYIYEKCVYLHEKHIYYMEIKRDIFDKLKEWKVSPYRKPLLLQGARQVGKSWVLEKFGETEFENVVVFNFDGQSELKSFFAKTKDVQRIIQYLSVVCGVNIVPHDTLIIFDEVQECNDALNSLKYFCENAPEYAITAAGSLLGVALNRKGSSFPVGKLDILTLYPITFREYLRVVNQSLATYLDSITNIEPIPELIFSQLTDLYRTYFITGGMPEAVSYYLDTRNIEQTDKVLDHIVKAYPLDFSKHIDSKDIPRVHRVWNNLHEQLAKDNKKFKYSIIESSARARDYENAIEWLCLSGLVHRVYASETARLPLSMYKDSGTFKLYLSDVGLLRKMFRLDSSIIIEGDRLFTEFKGVMAENFVLQSLVFQYDESMYYWSSGNQAELDFILQHKNQIIPIEVKSGTNVKGKSLSEYRKKNQPSLSVRLSLRNLSYDDGLLNVPLFMADYLKKLIDLKSI